MTPDRELKDSDAMNSSGQWLTCTTLGPEFKDRDAINNSRLRFTRTTPGRE